MKSHIETKTFGSSGRNVPTVLYIDITNVLWQRIELLCEELMQLVRHSPGFFPMGIHCLGQFDLDYLVEV